MIDSTALILACMNDNRAKVTENQIAVLQGLQVPHPEFTEEAQRESIKRDAEMFGHNICFQDDREAKAFQDGRLKL